MNAFFMVVGNLFACQRWVGKILEKVSRCETLRDALVSQHSVSDLRIIYIEALLAQIEPAHELVELGDASNL